MENIDFEISAKNGLRDVILGSEEKTSDLAAHFSRNSGAENTVLFTIQTIGVNLYTFGVALAPPPQCWVRPRNDAFGPRNHWRMPEYEMVWINPLD